MMGRLDAEWVSEAERLHERISSRSWRPTTSAPGRERSRLGADRVSVLLAGENDLVAQSLQALDGRADDAIQIGFVFPRLRLGRLEFDRFVAHLRNADTSRCSSAIPPFALAAFLRMPSPIRRCQRLVLSFDGRRTMRAAVRMRALEVRVRAVHPAGPAPSIHRRSGRAWPLSRRLRPFARGSLGPISDTVEARGRSGVDRALRGHPERSGADLQALSERERPSSSALPPGRPPTSALRSRYRVRKLRSGSGCSPERSATPSSDSSGLRPGPQNRSRGFA